MHCFPLWSIDYDFGIGDSMVNIVPIFNVQINAKFGLSRKLEHFAGELSFLIEQKDVLLLDVWIPISLKLIGCEGREYLFDSYMICLSFFEFWDQFIFIILLALRVITCEVEEEIHDDDKKKHPVWTLWPPIVFFIIHLSMFVFDNNNRKSIIHININIVYGELSKPATQLQFTRFIPPYIDGAVVIITGASSGLGR